MLTEERYQYLKQLTERFEQVKRLREMLVKLDDVKLSVQFEGGLSFGMLYSVPLSDGSLSVIRELAVRDLKQQIDELAKGLEEVKS